MLVKILVENTPGDACLGEHGLSMLVQYGGKQYLIDTGASALFAENADKMGVDLSDIDAAFLSHAHYDHAGGFSAFFARNSRAKVYLQAAARAKFFYHFLGPIKKYIGVPKGILEEFPDRFVYVSGAQALGDGISLLPHTTPGLTARGAHAHLYVETARGIQADDFSHEQTVIFDTPGGLVLFNSCSHGGVENIIEEVRTAFPDRPIRAFFGGFHMMGALGTASCCFCEAEVQAVAEKLLSSSKAIFYTGHCTGSLAFRWLREAMGSRLIALHAGMETEL